MLTLGILFVVLCNKTSVIKGFFKPDLGNRLETWPVDSYLGEGVRVLPGSTWGGEEDTGCK